MAMPKRAAKPKQGMQQIVQTQKPNLARGIPKMQTSKDRAQRRVDDKCETKANKDKKWFAAETYGLPKINNLSYLSQTLAFFLLPHIEK